MVSEVEMMMLRMPNKWPQGLSCREAEAAGYAEGTLLTIKASLGSELRIKMLFVLRIKMLFVMR